MEERNSKSHLEIYAKMRSAAIVEKLRNAMITIENEIEDGHGYPFNNGRLSLAEICRRAGVHKITLQGPTHRSTTRVMVKEWLVKLSKKLAGGKESVRKRAAENLDDYKVRYASLARKYNEVYAIEIVVRDKRLKAAGARIADLELELSKLRAQNSSGRVVMLPHVPGPK